MVLSASDIKKQDFKKSLRGYDANEVDAFLETVSMHYGNLLSENASLQDRIKNLESDINVYKENEVTLQKAIVRSQDLGDQIVENAKKQASMIVREAELDSQKMKNGIDQQIISEKHQLEELKSKNDKMIEELHTFFVEKLQELEDFSKNKRVYTLELATSKKSEDVPTAETGTAQGM